MSAPLALSEIADKADAYAEHLRDANSLRFALRNLAMLVREHAPLSQAMEEKPPAGLICLGCGERKATRYARDKDGFGFAMCDHCRLDEERP